MSPVHGNQHGKHHTRGQQPGRRRALTVEDGDDQDGYDVVGNGERGEEHANAGRHAVAQKRQDAQRERDVGCRGNAPAAHSLRVGGVEHQIDGDGRQNAADGGHDGQQRLADVGQLAHRELVFHFQAHQKEEHGHEHVVDHVRKRHLDNGFAEEEARMRMPELQERLVRGGVGHDERHHGGEQHGTGGLRGRMRQLDELLIAMLMALHLFDIDTAVGHVLPNLREAPKPPAKRSLLFHGARSVAKRAGGGSERPFPPFAIDALQAASRIRHSLSWRRCDTPGNVALTFSKRLRTNPKIPGIRRLNQGKVRYAVLTDSTEGDNLPPIWKELFTVLSRRNTVGLFCPPRRRGD